MNHEDGFLQSILADPDDDAPRLVYADWLEDNGEPDRAEFIRAQCRLATMVEEDPARPALVRQESRYMDKALAMLTAKPRPAWLAKLPARVPQGLSFARGFPACWKTTAKRFTQKAAELMAAVPLQHARLTNVRASVDVLARCPELAKLRSLDLSGEGMPPAATRVLFATRHLGGLRKLRYRSNQLTNEKVADLARAEWLSGVRELDLLGHSIRGEGFEALAASPHIGAVEVLDAGHSSVGPRAGQTLAGSKSLGRLRTLRLSGCRSGDAAAEALAGSERLDSLSLLDLGYNDLTLTGMRALLNPSALPALTRLHLREQIWPPEVWRLEPAERLRGGLTLHLLGENSPPVETVLGSSLLPSCRELGFPCAHIGDAGAKALAQSPAVRGLAALDLMWCDLTDAGLRDLADSPYLGGLRELSLEGNRPTEAGIRTLLEAPFARNLTLLDLSKCNLDEAALRRLAELPALEEIVLLRLHDYWWHDGTQLAREQLWERFGQRVEFSEPE